MTSLSHEKPERVQSVMVANTGKLEQQVTHHNEQNPHFSCNDSKSVEKNEEIEIYDCEDCKVKKPKGASKSSYDSINNV